MAPADISEIMGTVEELLDRSVAAEAYVIKGVAEAIGGRRIDLSKIDFEALREKFDAARKRTEAERLRALLSSKLASMVQLNRSRMNYLELLATLKAEKLELDWRKRQQSRAAVQICIRDTLDRLPEVYTAGWRARSSTSTPAGRPSTRPS